jgi:hypothetical protein
VFGVQVVFDLEAHIPGELLRSFAYQKMVISVLHDCVSNERRGANTFQARDCSGAPRRSVHAGRIELYNSLGVW